MLHNLTPLTRRRAEQTKKQKQKEKVTSKNLESCSRRLISAMIRYFPLLSDAELFACSFPVDALLLESILTRAWMVVVKTKASLPLLSRTLSLNGSKKRLFNSELEHPLHRSDRNWSYITQNPLLKNLIRPQPRNPQDIGAFRGWGRCRRAEKRRDLGVLEARSGKITESTKLYGKRMEERSSTLCRLLLRARHGNGLRKASVVLLSTDAPEQLGALSALNFACVIASTVKCCINQKARQVLRR